MVSTWFSPSSICAAARVAEEFLDRVLARSAAATEELQRFGDDLHRFLGDGHLARGRRVGVAVRGLARVGQGAPRHGAAQFDATHHVAQAPARQLMVDQHGPALPALVAVLQRHFECGAGDAR